ncbi:MAG: UDP-galactopyranose mutase [Bifidobacteriaceae bacterium]|nr:UDP-galactopyranose mutase [Bifidobacteriaceae bacterium]
MYDFLIVGAGLTGTVLARELTDAGKKCLVIDRRDHIAGNCYTQNISGINVHKYGAHIFHTDDEQVWNYVGRFAKFNNYINSPIAIFHDEIYNLPFNMNTFAKMWNVATPAQAREIIEKQKAEAAIDGEPKNLEEQALSLVGKDIFEKLIKEYTEKQWGRDCKELPADIIKRLPVRYTYDNNYFNHRFQGIPEGGYTAMVEKMLDGIEVKTGVSFSQADLSGFKHVIYTGPVDEYFDFRLGQLEWRSVRFETELLEGESNWQGNAVVNYTSHDVPYTRIIEHKHFEFGKDSNGNELPDTVISREYSAAWKPGDEPYYPVNDEKNNALYAEYAKLAESEEKVTFAGRLGTYKYYDMAPCIRAALDLAEKLLQK